MANEKISELTALTTPAAGDLIPIVDVSDTTDAASGTTKKIAFSDLFGGAAPLSVNPQTGTTYTIDPSDNGKVITFSNGSGITVTVPDGLGSGFSVVCIQLGAGQVAFAEDSTTINNRQGHTKLAGQYAVGSLMAYASDVFALGGDTAA